MNRRRFVQGSLVGTFALALGIRPTLAQDADGTPVPFNYPFEGALAGAQRQWDSSGLRLEGGMKYSTTVDVYDKDDNAKRALESFDDFITKYLDYLVVSSDGTATLGELKELSTPELGSTRRAITLEVTSGSTSFEMVMMFAVQGKIVHKWMGAGLANPTEELFDLAEKYMKFDNVDPNVDDELLSLLPALQDMPVGFTMAIENTYHNNTKEG